MIIRKNKPQELVPQMRERYTTIYISDQQYFYKNELISISLNVKQTNILNTIQCDVKKNNVQICLFIVVALDKLLRSYFRTCFVYLLSFQKIVLTNWLFRLKMVFQKYWMKNVVSIEVSFIGYSSVKLYSKVFF